MGSVKVKQYYQYMVAGIINDASSQEKSELDLEYFEEDMKEMLEVRLCFKRSATSIHEVGKQKEWPEGQMLVKLLITARPRYDMLNTTCYYYLSILQNPNYLFRYSLA